MLCSSKASRCKIDLREAVSCEFCKGFFHKRHVRKSAGAITVGCTYTCHKCQDGKCIKNDMKTGKSGLQKSKKASKISKKSGKVKQPAAMQNRRKETVVVPLRRSARNLKCVSLPTKKIGRRKKSRKPKSKKGMSRKPTKGLWQKKRTEAYHTYWLNGLLLSRKPYDERVMHFRFKKLIIPSEQLDSIHDQPKCSVCCEPEFTSTLNYISCDICGDWFHGDAFGLGAENISNLIGFKCHKCRNRNSPICPHLHVRRSDEVPLKLAAVPNSNEKDWRPHDTLMESKENTLLDDNTSNWVAETL
ncbi:unnamed protein product [Ilex paraguariensis]|uniref:Uncharacterized protein n=1 Tax=Ilex paraguariensis TaxID=185542 RepID=A0ABC8UTG7_9AQUA